MENGGGGGGRMPPGGKEGTKLAMIGSKVPQGQLMAGLKQNQQWLILRNQL